MKILFNVKLNLGDLIRKRMNRIPLDILVEEILPKLDIKSLLTFCSSCKYNQRLLDDEYLWKIYCQSVSSERLSNGEQFKQKARDLSLKIYSFSDFEIAWKDDVRYWQIQDAHVNQNPFGRFAYLRSVCWLDMQRTVKGIKQGQYQVIYRLKTTFGNRSYMNVKAKVIPIDKSSSIQLIDQMSELDIYEETKDNRTEDWIFVTNNNLLSITDDRQEFVVKVCETTSNWKYDLAFDCVMLRRVHNDGDIIKSQEEQYQFWRQLCGHKFGTTPNAPLAQNHDSDEQDDNVNQNTRCFVQ